MSTKLSFDELPLKVEQVWQELLNIKALLIERTDISEPESIWMTMEEVMRYDPAKRKRSTWYKMTANGEVPFRKNGKKLYFLRAEIDRWLNKKKIQSNDELKDDSFLK